jgi:hypothetical protein
MLSVSPLPLLAAVVLVFLSLTSCAPGAASQPMQESTVAYLDDAFWAHWGDGQAEVSSYDLTYPRYGSLRAGLAVTVFVTESFSLAARVKADPGKHAATDVFPVMKLNLIEDFQTGIYDYNEQTSGFLALASAGHQPPGHLTKVSFSSQEWCGHSWAQWITEPTGIRYSGHSYFDGEADRYAFTPKPEGGITEEQLMFWARGMAEPRLGPGGERTVPFRRSLQWERHVHQEAKWSNARLIRGASPIRATVPAGEFEAGIWRAELPAGPAITFTVEHAWPHRILEWSSSDGQRAVLVSSKRFRYWEMNKPGGERGLEQLGLRKRLPRMP